MPKKNDPKAIELWFIQGQQNGVVNGQVIYNFAKRHNFKGFLNREDGEALQKLGPKTCFKILGYKPGFLWGSSDGEKVPYLILSDDHNVVIMESLVDREFDSNHPALFEL